MATTRRTRVNGSKSSIRTTVLKFEEKKLELKRRKAEVFLACMAEDKRKSTTIAWQEVALDEEVRELEDEFASLIADRLALNLGGTLSLDD